MQAAQGVLEALCVPVELAVRQAVPMQQQEAQEEQQAVPVARVVQQAHPVPKRSCEGSDGNRSDAASQQ
jgi:hypothetical protein